MTFPPEHSLQIFPPDRPQDIPAHSFPLDILLPKSPLPEVKIPADILQFSLMPAECHSQWAAFYRTAWNADAV